MRNGLIAGLAMLGGVAAADAQPYPSRTVTAIRTGQRWRPDRHHRRIVMARAQQLLGQNIIIENVGGASGTIGTGRVVRAEPDGYTIGIGGVNHYVVNASVYSAHYDTLRDFEPISMLSNGPMLIMSRNSLPAKNLAELIVWLKGQSGQRDVRHRRPRKPAAYQRTVAANHSPATSSSSCRSAAPHQPCSRCSPASSTSSSIRRQPPCRPRGVAAYGLMR